MNYEKIVRQIRQKMFDYPAEVQAKAEKILKLAKAKMIAAYPDVTPVKPVAVVKKDQKPFYPVRFFGARIDEVNTQIAMVRYVGGHAKAEELSRLRNTSYPLPKGGMMGEQYTAKEVFRIRALREGFTDFEVDAFETL